jgi:hypothetical protein
VARDTTVTVGTNVNTETRRQLRKLAADRDITVSELLRRQIDDLLADHELAADA